MKAILDVDVYQVEWFTDKEVDLVRQALQENDSMTLEELSTELAEDLKDSISEKFSGHMDSVDLELEVNGRFEDVPEDLRE